MTSDENEPEFNWAELAEKLGRTPWDLKAELKTELVDEHLAVFNAAVFGRLRELQLERGVRGWARRVIRTDDFDLGYDSDSQEFWAVFAGEEILRLPLSVVSELVEPKTDE